MGSGASNPKHNRLINRSADLYQDDDTAGFTYQTTKTNNKDDSPSSNGDINDSVKTYELPAGVHNGGNKNNLQQNKLHIDRSSSGSNNPPAQAKKGKRKNEEMKQSSSTAHPLVFPSGKNPNFQMDKLNSPDSDLMKQKSSDYTYDDDPIISTLTSGFSENLDMSETGSFVSHKSEGSGNPRAKKGMRLNELSGMNAYINPNSSVNLNNNGRGGQTLNDEAKRYPNRDGSKYLDNTGGSQKQIDAYFVNNFNVSYSIKPSWIKEISLNLLVNNIFSEEYESNGYTYSYYYRPAGSGDPAITENFYYAQATRNFLLGATFKF